MKSFVISLRLPKRVRHPELVYGGTVYETKKYQSNFFVNLSLKLEAIIDRMKKRYLNEMDVPACQFNLHLTIILQQKLVSRLRCKKSRRSQENNKQCQTIKTIKNSNFFVIFVLASVKSSRSQMFFKIGVLQCFAIRKAFVLEFLFNKASGLKVWNFIKKRLRQDIFSFFLPCCEYFKIIQNTFFI